ncbi:MAG TPA: cation transporter [Thauera aminoaromatica]|uniref:Co/Zn/Cd efflux system component n=2 Tax=Thauera aminoaromatica TaxID=164330 RepID=C4ZLL4_THASP|nr:cation transporter [Thauera aminoaromatica]ACK53626.1 Co/Zn/Cd efflux system component [Thauera aminoaromatica]MCK6399371.1 cation transporter [Thauera aminoaromatica]HMV93354.1 cation transporter [Thauera aminoaromatica]HMX13709.1 cation transporter [Thauera aminoaromatica]HMY78451.1 cation transporter [Thauera aminoaromatica]
MSEQPSMDGEDLGAGGCCGTCGGAAPKPRLQPLAAAEARTRSVFRIPGMDCPSEEQMIRLRLAEAPVAALAFDLAGRRLTVDHDGDPQAILARLVPLGYGAELAESHTLAADEAAPAAPADDAAEARVLWILLALNAVMFVVELGAGIWARSAGLVADAMDMFADAAVYGVALYAVGRAARYKLGAARLAGGLQLVLALGALAEVVRRIVGDATPEPIGMMGIALLALAANVACLVLIARHREGGVHMKASYIFSANDVVANLGVIVAGVLVAWTGSAWPDWIIGLVIGAVVLTGAVRILRLG